MTDRDTDRAATDAGYMTTAEYVAKHGGKINDGGPAFPVEDLIGTGLPRLNAPGHPGMSLRDWFAGQALSGILRASAGSREPHGCANLSYEMADAMLTARSQGGAS